MQTLDIIRAWKDMEYRDTLTPEQLAELPDHPSGTIEFEEPDLRFQSAQTKDFTCGSHCHYTKGHQCRVRG